jgi:hypothetical protein
MNDIDYLAQVQAENEETQTVQVALDGAVSLAAPANPAQEVTATWKEVAVGLARFSLEQVAESENLRGQYVARVSELSIVLEQLPEQADRSAVIFKHIRELMATADAFATQCATSRTSLQGLIAASENSIEEEPALAAAPLS